jgi:hypothetical protein
MRYTGVTKQTSLARRAKMTEKQEIRAKALEIAAIMNLKTKDKWDSAKNVFEDCVKFVPLVEQYILEDGQRQNQ